MTPTPQTETEPHIPGDYAYTRNLFSRFIPPPPKEASAGAKWDYRQAEMFNDMLFEVKAKLSILQSFCDQGEGGVTIAALRDHYAMLVAKGKRI